MRATYVAALGAGLALGCVHAPSFPRAAKPREPVVLEAVSFETPAEDGWTIADAVGPLKRVVSLEHRGADGTFDRRAWFEEWVWPTKGITPDQVLAAARKGLPVTDARTVVTPSPEEAIALDGRFGPLSASGTVRSEPTPEGVGKVVRGSFHAREWIPPSPPDRWIRAGWVEREDGNARAGTTWAAELMDSIRSPPSPGTERSVPDTEVRGPMFASAGIPGWVTFAPIVGVASLRGERVVGGGIRSAPGAGVLYPRAGVMKGREFDVGLFVGNSAGWNASVATVGMTWWIGRARLRWGLGVEAGFAFLEKLETRDITTGLVLGARGSAQLDLVRRSWGDVFLGVDAGAATPWLYRAEALLGVRMARRRW